MQYEPGDIVVPILNNQEQTAPQELKQIHTENDKIVYELADGKYYPAVAPGNKLVWALVTLRHGYSVVPVEAGGKKPLVKWKPYQKKHPTEQELKSWWSQWPDANLAVICGEISGVIVLDIDGPEGEKYAKDRGLPESPTASTGKGRHVYLNHPGYKVGNFARKVPGLDLRGDGGYVVAPESWHSGRSKHYRWLKDPWATELADAPLWLLELLKEDKKEKPPINSSIQRDPIRAAQYWQYALQNAANMIRQAPDGAKHDTLIRASRLLGGYIAGGLGNENDAIVLLEQEIVGKPNVQSFTSAQQDIRDGIQNGYNEPITYEELETDRDNYAKQFELPPLPKTTLNDLLLNVKALREKQAEYWQKGQDAPEFTQEVSEIVSKSGDLTEAEFELLFDEIEKEPKPLVARKRTRYKKQWRHVNKGAQILDGAAVVAQPKPATWPYRVRNGCIEYLSERTFGEQTGWHNTPVCDFVASITEQITDEDGARIFNVAGKPVRGKPFNLIINAEDFGSEFKLKARLDAASGAKSPIRAGMGKHLAPAIKLLTGDKMLEKQRYRRTGWSKDGFLIPGKEQPGIIIELDSKLPYLIDANADLGLGLKALEALIESIGPEYTTPVLSAIFQAPLARSAEWTNERYGVFVGGRTGSFKTSFCQCAMAIYGPDFTEDTLLIKWGPGATANALMHIAASCHDMPFLIDNYKPNTGGGARAFIELIHNIVEGSEKDRLNRSAELRVRRSLFCWPICTGEDVPDSDPASLARILAVIFPLQKGEQNPQLTLAQKLAKHLCAVGNAWIDWLESDDCQDAVRQARSLFENHRDDWIAYLRSIRANAVNVNRVASNLATNELTWQVLCEHPTIGKIAQKYYDDHQSGLRNVVSRAMAEATAEALEAQRYLAALRELLDTDRVVLFEKDPGIPLTEDQLHILKDRHIGWQDSDSIYLLPGLARREVERLIGGEGLNKISNVALNRQLKEMEALASHDLNRLTKAVWIDDKTRRVLHLHKSSIELEQIEPDEIDF